MNKCKNCFFKDEAVICYAEDKRDLCDRATIGREFEAYRIIASNTLHPNQKGPGILEKIGNLGKAVVKHAIDGFENVSDDIYENRLAICDQCEHQSIDGSRECLICGCLVIYKAKLRSESCPIGLWKDHPEDPQKNALVEAPESPAKASTDCGCGNRPS